MNLFILDGGIKGVSFLGVLNYLYFNNKLNNIKNMFGCSAGSILVTLLAILKCPKKIYSVLKKQKNIILSDNKIKDLSLFNLNESINSIFKNYIPKDITILEFNRKYNCDINYIVTNYTLKRSELFNASITPNMKVYNAIKASCSIPLIFSPIIIENYVYVDGGIFPFYDIIKNHIHRNSIIIKQKSSTKQFLPSENAMFCICRNVFAIDFKNTKYKDIWIKNLSNYEYDELFYYGINHAHKCLKTK